MHVGVSTTAYSWGLLNKTKFQQSVFLDEIDMLGTVNGTSFSHV